MISDKLASMINPSTGNSFLVIADSPELQAGIRFWVQGGGHQTTLGFRFRITSKEGDNVVVPMDFISYVTNLFPEANWSGPSSTHVSMTGGAHINASIYSGDFLDALDKIELGAQIYDMLTDKFRLFMFLLPREEFNLLFKEEVEKVIGEKTKVSEGTKSAVVLQFGNSTKKFEGGVEVIEGDLQSPAEPQLAGDDADLVPSAEVLGTGDGLGELADINSDPVTALGVSPATSISESTEQSL